MEKQSLIIEGNIFDGMNFHGPFDNHEEAIAWAEKSLRNEWLVATLHQPAPVEKTYRYTSESCPSKHWNGGDDICEDCGKNLNTDEED